MNTAILSMAVLLCCAEGVQEVSQPKTRLYVRTLPPGAEIVLDGKPLGKSDGLFLVPPGVRKLTLKLEAHDAQDCQVEVPDGKITRVVVNLRKRAPSEAGDAAEKPAAGKRIVLGDVDDTAESSRSFADAGHAVEFRRPPKAQTLVAVQLFGSRYGYPKPPDEDFHIYLLDQDKKILKDIPIPYAKVERGNAKWYTFEAPPTKIPERFFVAVWFNAEQTKGVYVGMDKDVKQSRSYAGLPEEGFEKVSETFDWMIRAVVVETIEEKP